MSILIYVFSLSPFKQSKPRSVSKYKFYAYYSVRHESILKTFRDDTLYTTLLFPVSRSTCLGRNPRPSSGARG
jgi:hypothetical protein